MYKGYYHEGELLVVIKASIVTADIEERMSGVNNTTLYYLEESDFPIYEDEMGELQAAHDDYLEAFHTEEQALEVLRNTEIPFPDPQE